MYSIKSGYTKILVSYVILRWLDTENVADIARYRTMIDVVHKRLFCRLQPVAKMLKHSGEKPAFLNSNHC